MPATPQRSTPLVAEQTAASATRRAIIWLGSRLGFAASLGAALGPLPTSAKKKKKKRKKKPPPPHVEVRLKAENMTGANEVQTPGDPNGSGSGTFSVLSNGTICCEFVFETSTANSAVTDVHIHEGAAAASGPPVVNFNKKLATCVPIASSLADEIEANPAGFYANIHTQAFPSGAVRAQLALDLG